MIAGDVVAPSCYLDAIEILRRQYTAFLVDEAARRDDGNIPTSRRDATHHRSWP